MDLESKEPPPYKHIDRNEFSYRKHKKQKEEDIAICECQYTADDADSACGEQCLNALTSTECTPGYCACGQYCKNQRFQKCEYAKSRLFKTEDRGWGLLADENIEAGQLVIEYCGEVISCKEAKRRAQAYESEGLKDAYIIYLNAYESIDATRKGSLARFINHSCQPNCETRKWTVLGEVRVGIFAKQDLPSGTELSYDYNFEWYGGAMVRCLCGAPSCSGFLGAKSRGFQEAAHLWEDDDDRYSVENVPLYDSEDDEPTALSKAIVLAKDENDAVKESEDLLHNIEILEDAIPISAEPFDYYPMEVDYSRKGAAEDNNHMYLHASRPNFPRRSAMISRNQSNTALMNHDMGSIPSKTSPYYPGVKSITRSRKQLNAKLICDRLASREACEEILALEEEKNQAASQLDSVYDEIRPNIEEHERDSQDSVPTTVAEKWIRAKCSKYKADFDFSLAIIKNIACTPRRKTVEDPAGPEAEAGLKYLENGQ